MQSMQNARCIWLNWLCMLKSFQGHILTSEQCTYWRRRPPLTGHVLNQRQNKDLLFKSAWLRFLCRASICRSTISSFPPSRASYSLFTVSSSLSDTPQTLQSSDAKNWLKQQICTPDTSSSHVPSLTFSTSHMCAGLIWHFLHNYHKTMTSLTMEVTLDLEVSHTEPEHRQFVQTTSDLLWERQQAGQMVQLCIQAVPVAFGWIGLPSRRLLTETTHKTRGWVMLLAKTCLLRLTIEQWNFHLELEVGVFGTS